LGHTDWSTTTDKQLNKRFETVKIPCLFRW